MKHFSACLYMALACIFLSTTINLHGQTATALVKNLDTPWDILWGPDNYIWMTERGGNISRINPASGERKIIAKINEVVEQGESGLLGIALHPSFADTPWVYVAYTYSKSGVLTEKIVRFNYGNDTLTNSATMVDDIAANSIHDGCRLVFGPDRKLYATTGDAGVTSNSQKRSSLNGKILRVNADGSIPADNPFGNSYVWLTGLRNSQGLVWVGNKLFSSEHGANSDDEVNLLLRGRNFGWPNVQGFCNLESEKQFCNDSNVAEPLIAWTPTLAVCGMDYLSGETTFKGWENSLLLTTLKANKLMILSLNSSLDSIIKTAEWGAGQYGRLRDVMVAPNGNIYIATSNRDGRGNPIADDDRILVISAPVGVKSETQIFPEPKILRNPCEQLTISNLAQYNNIYVADKTGRIFYSENNNSQNTLNLNCDTWANGVYFISCGNNKNIATLKFIKQ